MSAIQTWAEGDRVSWGGLNKNYSGVIVGTLTRKKDGSLLGCLIKLDNGKFVVVHPDSFREIKTNNKS